ncbi:phosphoribosyltransferase [bacterium]|nr:phosphoribosyltransferase [bacterium]
MRFGERCLDAGMDSLEQALALARDEAWELEADAAGLGADCLLCLGEYRCGRLEHSYSRALMEFKDNKGRFGRAGDGARHNMIFFARCLAVAILAGPLGDNLSLGAIVPPKLNQPPADYHLSGLAHAVGCILEGACAPGCFRLEQGLLAFRSEIPPLKSVALSCREEVIHRGILCRRELNGCPVLLLDDILASGATVRECVRALREAGAGAVAVLALARRVE